MHALTFIHSTKQRFTVCSIIIIIIVIIVVVVVVVVLIVMLVVIFNWISSAVQCTERCIAVKVKRKKLTPFKALTRNCHFYRLFTFFHLFFAAFNILYLLNWLSIQFYVFYATICLFSMKFPTFMCCCRPWKIVFQRFCVLLFRCLQLLQRFAIICNSSLKISDTRFFNRFESNFACSKSFQNGMVKLSQ